MRVRTPAAKRTLAVLVLLMLSIVGSVTAVEIILRLADYKPELARRWYVGSNRRVSEPDTVTVNPQFLQDDFYGVEAGRATVVALGDSFTEGYPVAPAAVYPARLDALLRSAGCGMNVVNMGQGDSGTDQHLRLFTKHVLPRLQPDVVVWSIYPNDVWDNVEMATYEISGSDRLVPLRWPPSWVYIRQRIYEDLPIPWSVKRGSFLFNLLLKSTEYAVDWQVTPGVQRRPRCLGCAQGRSCRR